MADLRESGDLTHEERLDYVNAVLCLQHLPPRTPANVSTGARSRVSIKVLTTVEAEDRQAHNLCTVRRLRRHPHPADSDNPLYRQLLAMASVVYVLV